MVNGRWSRLPSPEDAEDTEFRLRYTNNDILNVTKNSLRNVIRSQYWSIVCRCPNTTLAKKTVVCKSRRPYKLDPWINIAKLLNVSIEQTKRSTQDKSGFAALFDRVVASAIPW